MRGARLVIFAALALAISSAVGGVKSVPTGKNMNGGDPYIIANGLPSSGGGPQFDTDFGTKNAEYFDVYAGPISTRYGEVFWQGLPAVPLPDAIVKRFANKTMAIVGYEMDQVIKAGANNNNTEDVSVPINYAYNHHYVSWLRGAAATMVDLDGTREDVTGHPLLMQSYAIDDPNPSSVIPTSQFFSEGNGGESRKSYHGYPRGVAQLIDSPEEFVITPMQIDTWNRNTSWGSPFVPGPESTASAAPTSGPDAVYSGHLECPCTDRVTKIIEETYATQVTGGVCSADVSTKELCFAAANALGFTANTTINATANTPSLPAGCSAQVDEASGKTTLTYNTVATGGGASCSGGGGGHATAVLVGQAQSVVSFKLRLDAGAAPGGLATLTLTGPDGVWFGVGLNAQVMKDAPNAIIVLGNGTVFEQKLGDQQAGSPLPMSLAVKSNTVTAGVRTVVATRALKGATAAHFSFSTAQPTLPFINAVGKGPDFAYHKMRAAATMSMLNAKQPTCVCSTGEKGFIVTDMNPEKQPFSKNCLAEPHGDLLALKNPTCTIEQYKGGLKCCKSGNILLDKHQNPWPNNKLTYYMKFRFWFQDYTPAVEEEGQEGVAGKQQKAASHQLLVRWFKETEANAGEYDVIKAPAGTAPEDTVYTIEARFQAREAIAECNPRTSPHCGGTNISGVELAYMSCHCHAPACISCELYNADTGDLLCRQAPVYGKSPAATKENPYDEKGYVLIPPCLYGDAEEGLPPRPFLRYDTNLLSVKKNNNTYNHWGEMAMWQGRAVQSYRKA